MVMDGAFPFCQANGRGPVVPDGYGIAYQVNRNSLSFNVTCLKDNPMKNFELSAERMQHYLREAGDHMREVFSTGQEIKAKL
jgi:carnitine O-acetyltransferase